MKTYKAIFNKEETEGVFGISLVHDPAMQGQFIALSKEKVKFSAVDEEKRILIGLVLEPNKPIYRNQNGHEFNIVFDEHTVKELSYNFFKASHHQNSSIEHETPIEGVTFVESWIVEDVKKDKSAVYGLSYPKGSWIATMKVDSEEVWNKYVKTGEVLGFSIDAVIKLEEIKMDEKVELKEAKTFLSQLSDALGLGKKDEVIDVKLGMVKTADGAVTLEWEGDSLESGVSVFVTGEDGAKVPAPVGEHELEDGNTLVIVEEGIASEVMPTAAAEEPVEELAAPAAASPVEPTADEEMDELIAQIKKITVQYSAETTALVSLKKEFSKLKLEFEEFKKEPAAKVTKSQPAQVEFNDMSNFEKLKYNREN
jgi:hypothetical protein